MTRQVETFKIRLTVPVNFSDWNGRITHHFDAGDVLEATHDTGFYFVTSLGGIYHSEAVRID